MDKFLQVGFIIPIDTIYWVSPIVVRPKKYGRWRVCIGFKPLNVATKKDPYPLPFLNEILDEMVGYKI